MMEMTFDFYALEEDKHVNFVFELGLNACLVPFFLFWKKRRKDCIPIYIL